VFGKSTLRTKELAGAPAWTRKAIEDRQAKMAALAVAAWRFQ
jgi:hypothetical protein